MAEQSDYPSEAEAWAYLASHGVHINYKSASKNKDAFCDLLATKWPVKGCKLNLHNFALVWHELRYRHIATLLSGVGPGRDVFNIDTLNSLKLLRLDGYWDVLIENACNAINLMISDPRSRERLSTHDYNLILSCIDQGNGISYHMALQHLFWGGSEPHKASNRQAILGHIPFSAYDKAYQVLFDNPPDREWNFANIMAEILEHGHDCKLVMLHTALWFNPTLIEPAMRQTSKDPIYFHLQKPICDASAALSGDGFKPLALTIQQVVINFTKNHGPKSAMRGLKWLLTSKFYTKPDVDQYYKRFIPGLFWDELAKELRRAVPDIPFQHQDLLSYMTKGKGPFELNTGIVVKGNLPTAMNPDQHARKLPSEVYDMIRREYGTGSEDRTTADAHETLSKTEDIRQSDINDDSPLANSSRKPLEYDNYNDYNGYDGYDDYEVDISDALPSLSDLTSQHGYATSAVLRKRKAPDIKLELDVGVNDVSHELGESNSAGRRPSKIIRLKVSKSYLESHFPRHTLSSVPKSIPYSPRCENPALSPQLNARNGLGRPSWNCGESSRSTSADSNAAIERPIAESMCDDETMFRSKSHLNTIRDQTIRDKHLNGPIPPSRRRQRMMTNLPYNPPRMSPTAPSRTAQPQTKPPKLTTPNQAEQSLLPSSMSAHFGQSINNGDVGTMHKTHSQFSDSYIQQQGLVPRNNSSTSEPSISRFSCRSSAEQALPSPMPNLSWPSPALTSLSSHMVITPVCAIPAPEREPTKVEMVVDILEKDFADDLNIEEKIASIDVLEDDKMAEIFCRMTDMRLRRAWLCHKIGKAVIPE